jgi:hypothetical protein
MKKICLSKLQYLLLALMLTVMAGCGANNAGIANNAGDGVAKAALVYGSKGTAKTTAALVDVPTNVAKVQFTVTGSGTNGALPVVTTVVTTTGGTVGGIYPGTVTVAAKAFDTAGAVVFEGFARNAVIAAGTTTDVGTIYMTAPVVKANEVACLGCHENTLDATGQSVVGGYKQSGHYSNTSFKDISSAVKPYFNKVGTGCVGCHGPQHNVNNPAELGTGRSGNLATSVSSARCFDCHNANAGNVANHDNFYVKNSTACAACHEVHDTAAGNMERLTWADSAHGKNTYAAMSHNSGSCARCHNGKALIQALANPNSPQQTVVYDLQMITCDACHTNATNGVLRPLATASAIQTSYTSSARGYKGAYYNKVNPNKKSFPDVGGSNVCIVCHSGSREGTSATVLATSDPYFNIDPTFSSTIAPHNLPAAAVMYVKFGFTNLSTGTAGVPSTAYLASLTADLDVAGGVSSTHRKLGTPAIIGDSHKNKDGVLTFATAQSAGGLTKGGPCAACHLTGSHSFKIDTAAINTVCNRCHSSENLVDITNIESFEGNFLEPQKDVFNNAISLAQAILAEKNAQHVLAGGTSFVTTTKSSANKFGVSRNSAALNNATMTALATNLGYDVTTPAFGSTKFIGALSNLIFISEDQGAYAHARTYARRLIYDSLDYLDDGVLNLSVGATALRLSTVVSFIDGNGAVASFTKADGTVVTNPVFGLYKKGTNAYNVNPLTGSGITTPYSGTSEDMLYVIGWDRTSGVWTSTVAGKTERP